MVGEQPGADEQCGNGVRPGAYNGAGYKYQRRGKQCEPETLRRGHRKHTGGEEGLDPLGEGLESAHGM
eukprot:4073726-Heterocapsa_arctica.AAC.1